MKNSEGFIDGVEILGLTIVIDGDHRDTEIDLGTLTLKEEDREFKLDVTNSYRTFENGQTSIEVSLSTVDEDNTFPDCPFNIKAEDLMIGKVSATLFYSCEQDWEYCTLFVKNSGLVKAIDVKID